ncbi:murein biosynthesis integral membrane protein MurJ [bacterium]|nr:murein biosynthesis integral membrane protein MurJ [bacterium]
MPPSQPDLGAVTAQSAFRATVLLTAMTFVSHCMGLGREAALASFYGAGSLTDAYFVALIVPSVLTSIFLVGLRSIMISLLGEYIYQKEKSGERQVVIWSMFHLFLAFSVFLAALVILCMPFCMKFIAPGFSPEQLNIAVRLVVILAGIVVFNSLTVWAQSVLQISQKFTAPAVSDLFFNATMITSIFVSTVYGGIYGVAWGMLGATAMQFLVQMPAVVSTAPSYRLVCDLRHPAVRNLALQTGPVMLRMAAHMVAHVVERALASKLVVGSISALNYALMAVQIPLMILGAPMSTVLTSSMTAIRAGGEIDRYRRVLVRSLRMASLAFMPAAGMFIVLRADIIQLLFQRGVFDQAAADLTAQALLYYSMGLLFLIWKDLALQAVVALKDFVTPVWTTILAMTVNTALNFILVRYMAHGGIALAKSLAEGLWAFCLLWQLRRRLGPLGGMEILRSAIKIGFAAAVAGVICHSLRHAMDPAVSLPAIIARLALLGTAYLAIFAGICRWMRLPETDDLMDLIRGYFGRRQR